jgi:hypothetical protein
MTEVQPSEVDAKCALLSLETPTVKFGNYGNQTIVV